MFGWFQKSDDWIDLELSGASGRLLQKQTIRLSYESALAGLSQSSDWRAAAPKVPSSEIVMKNAPGVFSISFPSSYSLFVDDICIWKSQEESCQRLQLQWSMRPQDLRFELPNTCSLRIHNALSLENNFLWLKRKRLAWLSALGAHGLIGLLMISGLSLSQILDAPEKKPLWDVSQIDVSMEFSNEPAPRHFASGAPRFSASSSLSESAIQQKKMKNLFRSLKSRSRGSQKKIVSESDLLAQSAFENSQNTLSAQKDWRDLLPEIEETPDSPSLNLSEASLAKSFRQLHPRLKECYDQVLIRDSQLAGQMNLWVDINQKGQVEDIQIQGKGSQASFLILQDCFQNVYKRLRLSEKPNQAFRVRQSLFLSSQDLAIR